MLHNVYKKNCQKKFLYGKKVIVWDFDGTLYRNKEVGENLERAYLNFLIKEKGKKKSLNWFRKETIKHKSWSQTVSYFTKIDEREILDQVEKKFKKHLFIRRDPKIVNFIKSLKNYRHIIFSNSNNNDIILGLIKLGFERKEINKFISFEKIFARDNMSFHKPSLESFHQIRKYTNEEMKRHLMVGDSYHYDLLPAKKVGMEAVHVNNLI